MNLKSDIIPAKSLGDVILGKKISEYSDLIERSNINGSLRYEQANIYSTKYSFVDFPIEINVDTRTGVIYKISALEGYLGSFADLIKIGEPAKNILNSDFGFYYDECEEAILSKKLAGIAIELDEDDPLPEEVIDLNVKFISVFDPELFKPKL